MRYNHGFLLFSSAESVVVQVGSIGAPALADVVGQHLLLVRAEKLPPEEAVADQQAEAAKQAEQVEHAHQEPPPWPVYMLSCQRRPSNALTRRNWIRGQVMMAKKASST